MEKIDGEAQLGAGGRAAAQPCFSGVPGHTGRPGERGRTTGLVGRAAPRAWSIDRTDRSLSDQPERQTRLGQESCTFGKETKERKLKQTQNIA